MISPSTPSPPGRNPTVVPVLSSGMGNQTSSSFPLTPPESRAPSPPAAKQIHAILPLPHPKPWVWRCHRCHEIYPLAVTRRCLDCSHTFCTRPVSQASPSSSANAPTEYVSKVVNGKVIRKKKAKKQERMCTSSFDYAGWAKWGSRRRSLSLSLSSSYSQDPSSSESSQDKEPYATYELAPYTPRRMSLTKQLPILMWKPVSALESDHVSSLKEKLYVKQQHSCEVHCDSPSECRDVQFNAVKAGRARVKQRADGKMGFKLVLAEDEEQERVDKQVLGHDAEEKETPGETTARAVTLEATAQDSEPGAESLFEMELDTVLKSGWL